MNHARSFALLFLFLLLLSPVSAITIFEDDFSRADCLGNCWGGNWSLTNLASADWEITNGVALFDDGNVAPSPSATGLMIGSYFTERVNVSFRMRVDITAPESVLRVLNSSGDVFAQVSILSDSVFWANATGLVDTGHDMVPDLWQDVFLDVDISSGVADYYVNGTLIGSNFNTYESNPSVSAFSFSAGGGTGTDVYFDNVTVSSGDYLLLRNFSWVNNVSTNATHNFVRNLNYELNVSCDLGDGYIAFLVNGVVSNSKVFACDESLESFNGSYTHSSDGFYNASFFVRGVNATFLKELFFSDVSNPSVSLSLDANRGFINATANASITCTDDYKTLGYNMSLNNVTLLNETLTASTTVSNYTIARYGNNFLYGECSDLFGTGNSSLTKAIYGTEISLIDEVDNNAFDVANITSAKVYFDDNSSLFNFTGAGTSHVNFTSSVGDKLRFEFVYADGTVITRYVDASLVSGDLRVCVNTEGVQHFEQLIISAISRPVVMESVFANCIIVADYTRFAYQDSLLLKAYTIDREYDLYTISSSGAQSSLAGVDGSVASFINLDNLEFIADAEPINILADALSFSRVDNTTVSIYYENLRDDNTGVNVTITREDTNVVVYSSTAFADPNKFTIVFDTSSLSNVNDTTLFSIDVVRTTADGEEFSAKKYFNLMGQSGDISAGFAILLSIILMVFGLTITSARAAFSWFGIVVTLASIVTLSFAVQTWATLFLMAVEVIIAVFLTIVLVSKNTQTVA